MAATSPATLTNPYLEDNLRLDYNHLESLKCFCERPKEMGAIFCRSCLEKIPVDQAAALLQIKPGDGLATSAAIVHSRNTRAKGWLG